MCETPIQMAEQHIQTSENKGEIIMHRFLIVIEKAGKNFSAYSPDLPGCVATGKTREDAEEQMHEAIGMHIRSLLEDGLPAPKSHSSATYIAVRAE